MSGEFLPDGYEQPKGNANYMKLEKGENKFRILSKPILGYVDWKDNKPMRFQMNAKPERSVDPKKPIKHFWAMIVWNYNQAAVQILEVHQSSIHTSIIDLSKNSDWGAPYAYDLKIIKKGDGLDTEYTVNPVPHKKLPDEIVAAFLAKPCNLNAMYAGDDPWAEYEDSKLTAIEDMPF